jgi:hypothetical protein
MYLISKAQGYPELFLLFNLATPDNSETKP